MNGSWMLDALQHPLVVLCYALAERSLSGDVWEGLTEGSGGAGQGENRCKGTGMWPISAGLENVCLVWLKSQSPADGDTRSMAFKV